MSLPCDVINSAVGWTVSCIELTKTVNVFFCVEVTILVNKN